MGGEIIVVGMGPGPVKYLTREASDLLLAEDEIYFRMSGHPVYDWLRGRGKECVSFDPLYGQPGITYDKVYRLITRTLVKAASKKGRVVYALPGNPVVFEKTPFWMRDDAGPLTTASARSGTTATPPRQLEWHWWASAPVPPH